MGVAASAPMASTKIEDYYESIRKFISLSKPLYGSWGFYDMSYQSMLEASEYGAVDMMTIGTHALCVQWRRCPGKCNSPSWN